MMNKRFIGYWVVTAFVAFAFGAGGIADLMRSPDMVAGMQHLGYAPYVLVLLGAWKVAGAAAVVAPRLPLLKEWAYAGMVFDLTGASISHAASGDPVKNIVTPLIVLGFVTASWLLRPASRRLPGTIAERVLEPAALAAQPR